MSEDELYALMAAARTAQEAVDEAVAGMQAESAARAERSEVQEAAMHRMEAAATRLEAMPERIGEDLVRAVDAAVVRSARAGLAEQREATGTATREALAEGVGSLRAATASANAAADRLGWRRTAATAAVGAAMIVATVGAGHAVDWWQGGRISEQRATIARLAPEVERLEALEARAAAVGPAVRLLQRVPKEAFMACGEGVCVRVDERAQFETPDDPAHSTLFLVWGSDG